MALIDSATATMLYLTEPSVTAVSSKYSEPRAFFMKPKGGTQGWTALSLSYPETVVDLPELPASEWTEIDQGISKLLALRDLTENWDGYGASAPKQKTIETARLFLRSLSPSSTIPKPTLHADGNVILFYRQGDDYVEIEFFDDGHAEFYSSRGDKEWSGDLSAGGAHLPIGLREVGFAT